MSHLRRWIIFALFAALAVASAAAQSPIDFGRREIDAALSSRGLKAQLAINIASVGPPESFEISFKSGSVAVKGTDPNGAMYGALELAERIRRRGAAALTGGPITGRPFLRDRGWNLFLTLPWDYGRNNTDYDPKALNDPARWWFQNDKFWQTLFDQMARARLNWLDLHGSWDVSVTDAPNLYAYFIQSERFPKVGVAAEIKAANLERLNKIIRMAHERGVRVSLMAYEARFRTPHAPDPYPENEADLYAYTREVVEKMIRQAPALDAIGFRIGESGHGEAFFNCYLEAVKNSGRDIPLITRSWLARKSRVVPLAKASKDFTVEIKYNGEQWGAPYMVMGGRMAGWYSYSFEDYLSDSGSAGAARLWPGNPAAGGESWPSQPYKIVWQVRANGTHRILPVYNPAWVRRAVRSMLLGTASGFTVEGLETYYPKSPRYYLANLEDAYCDWTHERDWMYLTTWGRLGYDPDVPDSAFEALLAEKLGPAAARLSEYWTAASRIVSTAFSAFSLGPDHRNHAIELEWGGDIAAYLAAEPFDSHVFKSVKESLAEAETRTPDGRISPPETAARLEADAALAAKAADISAESVPPQERKRLKELKIVCGQASYLGRYYAERLMAAWRWGQGDAQGKPSGGAAWHMQAAEEAWRLLASNPFYRPFTERLRMRTNTFHWSQELPKITAEAKRLAQAAAPASDPIPGPSPSIKLPTLSLKFDADRIICTLPAQGVSQAWALVKALPSSAFFHRFPMALKNGTYEFSLARDVWGHAIAAEIKVGEGVFRLPGWNADAPYLVVPSKPGPTPLIYSSEEAMAYLDPSSLTPSEFGLLLLSTRAWNFHRSFAVPVQRKLLDSVSRGLDLVVLAQDYASGRYSLNWLPNPLKVQACQERVFDPAGALGLSKIESDGIMLQRFLPSPGWEVLGNGGVATLKWGEGRIYLINARLLERMHVRVCAEALDKLLSYAGRLKPVVVVDAGTEGGALASSVVTDFMNAHSIPFLTLGEVIASKQGVRSSEQIPGKIYDDSMLASLGLRGTAMLNTYLEKKVMAAAALPAPATKEAFNRRLIEQRREFQRCLGLDPLPPRTALNARVVGVLQRKGYRIEKIVFESRPNFPVTCHLYIPDGSEGKKLPVIVNPHGHWGYKKQEPTVQSRLIGQALSGYLALVVDSPGYSFEGNNRVERRWAGTHDDLKLTLGSQTATNVYVWDLMRALDYLETRPEADMRKVGITGASGGGLATMWAFAADARFTCGVPVVYASSMEVNPHNGCLCNHVPGGMRLGDRADVLALRAPAPVLIIGAEVDSEFPEKGMRLTGEKLRTLWSLFAAEKDVWLRIFPGGHDYNKPMRETALGFFDKYLKGQGDGAPVLEPAFTTEPPESEELYCLPDPPKNTQTMRGIAAAMFGRPEARQGGFAEFLQMNGGLPAAKVQPELKVLDEAAGKRRFAFNSEKGLTIPGIWWEANGTAKAWALFISENGKAAAPEEFDIERLRRAGIGCLAIDPRGLGELKGIDQRLTTYLGEAPALGMAWDIVSALEGAIPQGAKVAVVGRGATAGQAALFASLISPRISFVAGIETLKEFQDAFRDDVQLLAIAPRANYCPSLSRLRGLSKARAVWSFLGEKEPPWMEVLFRWAAGS